MEVAIAARDFSAFARLAMIESNQLHAVCLDSFPPINYLTKESWSVIETVHKLNQSWDEIVCAYTFDAGPNAFVFTLEQHYEVVRGALTRLHYQKIIDCRVGSGPVYK
jgi:diphosphomevalonate decarboxylase